jgi:YegS/Rv2252/BmrU family lipid kinase
LINPNARRPPKAHALREGLEWLARRDWKVDCLTAHHPGEIAAWSAQAAQHNVDAVMACGGDGTLNEALAGVAGTDTALAHLPSGTMNVWAKEVHLPRDPIAGLRLIDEGERVRLDTGLANGRPFLLMASAGLDSLVAGRVSGALKRRLSFIPYLGYAALELKGFTGMDVEVLLDESRIMSPVVGMLIGNTRSYGGLLEITAHARADDGLLDVCLFHGRGRLNFLRMLALALAGRHLVDDTVTYRQAQRISVSTAGAWPVQLDGEVAAETPLTVECVPRSVTMIVPRGLQSPLWHTAPLS